MPSPATLHIVSDILYTLNRVYAYWSFLVNYTLYTSLWLLGGIPPNVDARVDAKKGWHPGVFVTGSEGDVGRETVRILTGKGYTVFAGVRSEEEGEILKKGLTSSKLKGSVHPVLSKSLKKAVDDIRQYGEDNPGRRLVAVVCNVGISPVGPLESMTDEEINNTISLDLRTQITVGRTFLPLLTSTPGQKRIIYLSSCAGYAPLPGHALFSACAAALDSLARGMTMELTPKNVRTTVVRTGCVRGSRPPLGEAKGYEGLMRSWRSIASWTEMGTPAAHIAQQVHDALTDLWMQPCYTVGVDALLLQMVRDFIPEPVWEWAVGKMMM